MKKAAAATVVTIAISISIAMLMAAFDETAAAQALDSAPAGIHLSWCDDPTTTMAVCWITDTVSQAALGYTATVEYGTSEAYGSTATGESIPLSDPAGIPLLTSQVVKLTGLEPDTLYHYRCGDSSVGMSADFTFRTAPKNGSFTFLTFGDTRNDYSDPFYENNDFSVTHAVAERMKQEDAAFFLHNGDYIFAGQMQEDWGPYLRQMEILNAYMPIASAHGNHEYDSSNYYDLFAMPDPEAYYSFDVCSVHFIVLDTGLTDNEEQERIGPGSVQYNWLVNDLEAARQHGYDWTVVQFHRPPYSSDHSHGNATDVIDAWVPLFDEYGVDVVNSGHVHNYQRTYPMRGNEPVLTNETAYYENVNGTTYMVTGGGGAPLYDFLGGSWIASGYGGYHYARFDVSKNGTHHILHCTAKDIDGNVFDEFTVTKTYSSESEDSTGGAGETDEAGNRIIVLPIVLGFIAVSVLVEMLVKKAGKGKI